MTEQKKIPRSVWYGLDGTGYDNIAQEIASEDPLMRKWVSIYAIYKYQFTEDAHQYFDFIHNSKNSKYALIIFTIPIEKINTNDGLDDRDIIISEIKTMGSEEEINTSLATLKIDPELFAPPWRCDYPL
jgi:hypothetical protein